MATTRIQELLSQLEQREGSEVMVNALRVLVLDILADWEALEHEFRENAGDAPSPDLELRAATIRVLSKHKLASRSQVQKRLAGLNRRLAQLSWCSFLNAARDFWGDYYWVVFEIASHNPGCFCVPFTRNQDDSIAIGEGEWVIHSDTPAVFAAVVLELLQTDICHGVAPITCIDNDRTLGADVLGIFVETAGLSPKQVSNLFVMLRNEVLCSVSMRLATLSAQGQIELAKRGWTAAGLVGNTIPQPKSRKSSPEPVITLRDAEMPPKGTSRNEIVRRLCPVLQQEIASAREWAIEAEKGGLSIDSQQISERFPLLRQASKTEIDLFVLTRTHTALQAAMKLIEDRARIKPESVDRYRNPMRSNHRADRVR